jgi:CelD/BcsL family acetyltransferase involved in cellulose biosynthesis
MEFNLHTIFPDELESEWNTLLEQSATHVPFLRFEYLRTWWQTRGGGEWNDAQLAIVTAHHEGQMVGIAPLFTALWKGKQALLLLGSIEISDYLDLIASEKELPDFCNGLLEFLRSNVAGWEVLDFYNLLESSPTMNALQTASEKQGWKFEQERLQHSPFIPLPGDWETYLAGIDKKQRHEIRRKMRRAAELELPVRWYIASDPSTIENEIDAFMQLMENDGEKASFLTAPMREQMRLVIHCAFERGCLHLAFLEIGGEKAAAYLSFDYLNRLWVYNSGIDPRFREYSPGWVLLGELLKWANEQHREEFDFMRGDEDYKYRFGAIDRFILRTTISRN